MRQFTTSVFTLILCGFSITGAFSQTNFGIAGHTQADINPFILSGDLETGDKLGASFAPLGLFTGTSSQVIAVGTRGEDFTPLGYTNSGAIWLYEVGTTGELNFFRKIDAFDIPDLDTDDNFGESIDNMGDFNGDGVVDIVVGAPFDSLPGMPKVGSIYLVTLNADATVQGYTRITDGLGGIPFGTLGSESRFGSAVRAIGDLDGNGATDIVVGAPFDLSDAASPTGAIYVLFMKSDGTVKKTHKIDRTSVALAGSIDTADYFGHSIAYLGDISGTGFPALAVGAPGAGAGSVHIISLKSSGVPNSNIEINDTDPLLALGLDDEDGFGLSLGLVGDLDGDGIEEIGVGAPFDDDTDDGFLDKGAVWIMYLDNSGNLKETSKISVTSGGFTGYVGAADFFGNAVVSPGDIDGDGLPDMLIGARNEVVGGNRTGNFFLMKCIYCRTPQNLKSLTMDTSTVGFTWDHIPSKKGYKFQLKRAASSSWDIEVTTTKNNVVLDTLDPGETYDWQVVGGCGNTLESYESIAASHLLPRIGKELGASVVPNPTKDFLVFTHGLPAGKLDLFIYDITGALRYEASHTSSGSVTMEDLSFLAPGAYWIEAKQGELSKRSKFVITK